MRANQAKGFERRLRRGGCGGRRRRMDRSMTAAACDDGSGTGRLRDRSRDAMSGMVHNVHADGQRHRHRSGVGLRAPVPPDGQRKGLSSPSVHVDKTPTPMQPCADKHRDQPEPAVPVSQSVSPPPPPQALPRTSPSSCGAAPLWNESSEKVGSRGGEGGRDGSIVAMSVIVCELVRL